MSCTYCKRPARLNKSQVCKACYNRLHYAGELPERVTYRSFVPVDWQEQAACQGVDVEVFFPEVGGTGWRARQICAECPVRQECLDYAIAHHESQGIWAGLNTRERRAVARRRVSA